MTKQESLAISLKMWEYLVKNPRHDKRQALEVLGLPRGMPAGCAACQYDLEQSVVFNQPLCALCPIWTGAKKCYMPGEAFNTWSKGRKKFDEYNQGEVICRDAAQEIVDMVRTRMKDIDEESE